MVFDHTKIREDLLYKANKILIDENVLSLKITAVDSKPVKALTKHNNPKNPRRDQKKKNKKIKRLYKPEKGMIVIADKAYDIREFYTFVVEQINAEPIICINPRNTQPDPKFNGYGCTAYQDLTDDARSRVQRDTPRFNQLYAKRIVVEQTFSRLRELKIEEARHYFLTAIRNANTIDYLALALVALAAKRMKKPKKIRCFRTFMKAA